MRAGVYSDVSRGNARVSRLFIWIINNYLNDLGVDAKSYGIVFLCLCGCVKGNPRMRTYNMEVVRFAYNM